MIHFVRRFAPPPVFKLFLFMGIVWAAIAGPLSSVLILKSLGATSQQIGAFSAICAVISMVFQPMWGFISDKIGSPRRVLCACLGASAVFFGSVLLTRNIYVAAGLFFLDTMFRCCVIPLMDSHTLFEVKAIPGLQYNYIRMAASLFYGVASLVYSGIIGAQGAMAVVPISVGIAVVAVLWGVFVAKGASEAGKDQVGVQRARPSLKKDAAFLLRNGRFIGFLIFVSVWALATMPLYTFIIDYVTAVGGNPGHVPLIHALRCVGELPFHVLVGFAGRRMDSRKLMFIGMCFWLAHMVGLFFANTFFWLAAANFLASPGFILGFTGRLRYLSELAPESVRSTSITLMGACEMGLGAIAGNLIAGFVSGTYGTQALTLISIAALCVSMATLLFVLGPSRSSQSA